MKPNKERSPNWGGKRPGAGRKSSTEPMQKILVALPVDIIAAIDAISKSMGESRNATFRRAVLAFLMRTDGNSRETDDAEKNKD